MLLHTENPLNSSKFFLEMINKLSKFAGYKTNIQRSVVLLSNNNEISEKEIEKTTLFTMVPKTLNT